LGDRTGPGYVSETQFIVQDSVGQYWLGQFRDMVKIFRADGTFVRTLGRKGEGPGEFDTPVPIRTDGTGRVHIWDAGNPRITVVRPDFTVDTIVRLPINPWLMIPLHEQDAYVGNLALNSLAALGHPFHLIRGSRLVRSFGAPHTEITYLNDARRVFTADADDRVFSARFDAFSVDVWDPNTGERIARFEGPPFREAASNANEPILYRPRPTLNSIQVAADGRLWLLLLTPNDDWRDHMEIVQTGDGRRRYQPLDGSASIWGTEVIVVDLSARRIVARTRRREHFPGFVGSGQLLEIYEYPDGSPEIRIWSVQFDAKR